MNDIVRSLPTPIKLNLGNVKTLFDKNKKAAIKAVDTLESGDFPVLNSKEYKTALKKFFTSNSWTAKRVEEFTDFLYHDKITMLHQGNTKKGVPYVICVVKNEADKLVNFFNHYKKLGQFNYVFIDNGSTDNTVELIIQNGGTVYQCLEPFATARKTTWFNKVSTTFPQNAWIILLDADELLVYDDYENTPLMSVLQRFDQKGIDLAGAVMIDMFANRQADIKNYINNYVYFENNLHEEKSIFYNSVYGGIREREFRTTEYGFGSGRVFLVKKHPVIKNRPGTLLIGCHYIYPFTRNYKSSIYFGLLHYKLFDKEIEKYKKIAKEGSYGNGSVEYKSYLKKLTEKTYEEIFAISPDTIRYEGSSSLEKISCIKKWQD